MSRVMSTPTTQPQATTGKPTVPSFEQIAKRAYEKWVKRGKPHGNPNHDWFEAELELRKELTSGTFRP